jgi:hypothetical protein
MNELLHENSTPFSNRLSIKEAATPFLMGSVDAQPSQKASGCRLPLMSDPVQIFF